MRSIMYKTKNTRSIGAGHIHRQARQMVALPLRKEGIARRGRGGGEGRRKYDT